VKKKERDGKRNLRELGWHMFKKPNTTEIAPHGLKRNGYMMK
jgi:hypothetical protein